MSIRQRTRVSIDMTAGNLWRDILRFSLPLMVTNVLQVLFNMSDVAVVGRFAGAEALGAVGSTPMLVSLFTGLPIGLGAGVNVVIARHLGERDDARVTRGVRTSFFLCLGFGLLLLAVMELVSEPVLRLMKTKEILLPGAVRYMQLYALGMPAMCLYNFGAGVLCASGDTKRPMLILMASGLANIAMNLFFVIVCGMAEAGVAIASAISQCAAAALVCACLLRSERCIRLTVAKPYIDVSLAKEVVSLGLPAALQYAIFAVANMFIQSAVNYFEPVIVEGNAAAQNADGFAYDIMAAIYTGCSSFVSFNLGAKRTDRVQKTYIVSTIYSFAAGALIGTLLLLFGQQFLSLFTTDAEVMAAGETRLKIMAYSYAFSAFMDCAIAASRGLGKTVVPTVIVVMGSCVFRVIWVYTVFAHFHTIASIYSLYIISWLITAIAENIYLLKTWRRMTGRKPETAAE